MTTIMYTNWTALSGLTEILPHPGLSEAEKIQKNLLLAIRIASSENFDRFFSNLFLKPVNEDPIYFISECDQNINMTIELPDLNQRTNGLLWLSYMSLVILERELNLPQAAVCFVECSNPECEVGKHIPVIAFKKDLNEAQQEALLTLAYEATAPENNTGAIVDNRVFYPTI